jgi:hypothetical protein
MRFKTLKRRHQLLIVFAVACGSRPSAAQTAAPVRLDVTRDAWVSSVGQEADGNNGGAPRLKLKTIQEMTLVDVDARPLLGKTIRSAALHMQKSGAESLLRVTIGSVGAEWSEGTGSGYAIQASGATFHNRRHPNLPWSTGGGDLCHVILGNGGTLWGMADASAPDREGWQRIAVDPRVVAARIAGLSHGFLVFDDTGSEWTRRGETFSLQVFPNRFLYSRDQNRASAPYLTVELGPSDRQPPGAPLAIRVEPETAALPAGEAVVSWQTPADTGPAGTLGYLVSVDGRPAPRELIPLASAPGTRVAMTVRDLGLKPGAHVTLSIRAVDAAGNGGAAATAIVTVSQRAPRPLPALKAQPRRGSRLGTAWPRLGTTEVAIIDELDKIHPVSGDLIPPHEADYTQVNPLWDAAERTITLHAARNEFVAFQVVLRGDESAALIAPELAFEDPEARRFEVELGRYHPVTTPVGPLGDPIVPLDFPASPIVAQRYRSLHVELYVPATAAPGAYRGELKLRERRRAGGLSDGEALVLPVSLTVWNFTLPDHLSFLPEMNCYGLPENERDYYRLAHRHRTVLNRVPYSQSGEVQDGCAPAWDGRRLELDWGAWDRRFGPLLDGSAFADSPRKNVPLECFYLPLHENWPTPMEGSYNGSYWADRAFPEAYRRAFVTAAGRIAAHFKAKRWNDTLFECFLNNKNNFKARGWSRGSSPWLLDEPANFQDYWALRYFARAFHQGIGPVLAAGPTSVNGVPRLVFRADISRPQWRRDSLDGLLDVHVVSSAMRVYPRLVFDRKRALGEIVLEYGSSNAVEGSNVQPAAWCVDVWARGADGVIPWQTVGNSESWDRADELALLYPSRGRGPGRRPVPSVRLKAYRRGQQDVEYLVLWSHLHDEPRWAVGQQVRAALRLAGARQSTGFAGGEDAGRIDYGRLRPSDLWSLRVALGQALSDARPIARSKLVDLRPPVRDPDHLPRFFGDAGVRD